MAAQFRQQRPVSKYVVQPHYADEQEAQIDYQPYRTTPLVLPGAKVKKDVTPTESYLRHHPNPAMRGPVHHTDDVLMKQRVADSVLNRVVGEDAIIGKVQHKQFNSPIGLYSDSNIENTIRQTVPSATPSSVDPSIFIDLSFLEQKQKILGQQQKAGQPQYYQQQRPQQQQQHYQQQPQQHSPQYSTQYQQQQPQQYHVYNTKPTFSATKNFEQQNVKSHYTNGHNPSWRTY